jgi:hypothetical protein
MAGVLVVRGVLACRGRTGMRLMTRVFAGRAVAGVRLAAGSGAAVIVGLARIRAVLVKSVHRR